MKQQPSLLLLGILCFFFAVELNAQTKEVKSKTYNFNIDSKVPSPTEYIQKYVLDRISLWQKKGRYETTADYRVRVTEQNRKKEANRLAMEAEQKYLKTYFSHNLNFQLVDYDADNQSFLFKNNLFGQIVVPVPLKYAQAFEHEWRVDYENIEYYIDGEVIKLKKLPFTSQNITFLYDNTKDATFAATDVNVQLPELELDLTPDEIAESKQSITRTQVTVGLSDVDVNIPITNSQNEKTFVVIIANEAYRREVKVPYAVNDGRIFKEYCIKTLGIPAQYIHMQENATLNDLRHEIAWISNVMRTQNGEANVLFYYAGHGIPDESTQKAYLLPVDGYAADYVTGYSLDELYAQLGAIPAQSVTYFIDACFSGSKHEQGMLASARGVSIKAKNGVLSGNSVVFSAANGEQTAFPYHEKQHGMFTYFLLKKLQETQGNVTYQELGDYISDNVEKQSVIINSKMQSPIVKANVTLHESWKNWKLK